MSTKDKLHYHFEGFQPSFDDGLTILLDLGWGYHNLLYQSTVLSVRGEIQKLVHLRDSDGLAVTTANRHLRNASF